MTTIIPVNEHNQNGAKNYELAGVANLAALDFVIEQASTFADTVDIQKRIDVLLDMARIADYALEQQNEIALRRLLAIRRGGQILEGLERERSRDNNGKYLPDRLSGRSEYGSAIDEASVTERTAQRWQLVGRIPDDTFNEYIDETIEKGVELTFAGLLRFGQTSTPPPQSPLPAGQVNIVHADMLNWLSQTDDRYSLIIADPPYNVTPWEWDKRGSRDQFLQETTSWIDACLNCSEEFYHMFWFCSPQYMADIEMLMRAKSLPLQSRLVWHRRNMAMGSDAKHKFIDSWECIFHIGNRELNFDDNWSEERFDVQTFAVPQTNFTDTKLHPTQKPLALIQWIVRHGSCPGEHVLDPFAGSGTTGHAALELGRICTLIENNAEYVDVIQQRLR